ncbi:hypothetical protein [Sporosarcina beigongshangi]|uniref:hypothetical protein n=1 Tax=Sporosarcina beigongshangi TaxID=2782538 RepID=UPI0019397ADE|nr:hypothetical protein [Sporosarcina beigongshangi]
MEFNMKLDKVVMEVKIEELKDEGGEKVVSLIVEDLDSAKIDLSNSSIDEVKDLFDKIYEYIISQEQLIVFDLINTESNLFIEVATDLVEHLNSEIEQSEVNFAELIHRKNNILRES